MTLGDAKVGSTVVVTKIEGDSAYKRRIMDMGITKGSELYIRRYFHGCYLLCGNQCNYRKSKRKEDQSSDVHSCRIICSEIHFLIIYNYSIERQITGARFFYFITLSMHNYAV